MKQLADNQLVGTGDGFAHFRNLYEKENGERVSVPTSKEFWPEDERHLTTDQLLDKYRLDLSIHKL